MANEFIGVLDKKLEKKTGEGKNGTWESIDFVVKTVEQYPQVAVFNCFNNMDLIEKIPLGCQVKVFYNMKANESDGKWFNKLQAWRIDNLSSKYVQADKTVQSEVKIEGKSEVGLPHEETDLPF